jgi:hypothetical protein
MARFRSAKQRRSKLFGAERLVKPEEIMESKTFVKKSLKSKDQKIEHCKKLNKKRINQPKYEHDDENTSEEEKGVDMQM